MDSFYMNPELQERIHTLWDELADMDATRFDAVADRLMVGLCELVDAQNAVWIGSVRLGESLPEDPVKGWRASVVRYLYPTQPLDDTAKEQLKNLHRGVADETTVSNVAGAGRFRANRLRDLVSEEWFNSPYYHVYYRGVGLSDAVFIAFPINADAESWFGVFREIGKPDFSAEERDILAYALRGSKWFHRQLMLNRGLLIASAPLTPAERRVLQLLLSRASEKDMGVTLGLTANSVHQYVVTIFRKFGVNSRAALMSLWLGAT
jgi:DNA-binding CsgD family transcriptional regulator